MQDYLQIFNHLAPGNQFSEDCAPISYQFSHLLIQYIGLNLDVIIPATGVQKDQKLPIVVVSVLENPRQVTHSITIKNSIFPYVGQHPEKSRM